jgi:hypothetical protein
LLDDFLINFVSYLMRPWRAGQLDFCIVESRMGIVSLGS